jgi:hypothetical protein
MKPYKPEEEDEENKQVYKAKAEYPQDTAEAPSEEKYDKKMSRRLSIPEFVKKYKLNNDVGKD